jgi:hypothetical protein
VGMEAARPKSGRRPGRLSLHQSYQITAAHARDDPAALLG